MFALKVADVRAELKCLLLNKQYVVSRGSTTVEIVGASFLADEGAVLGAVCDTYAQRELAWYMSQSLNIADFPTPVPKIWEACAGKDGSVNSNYGWCMFSKENGHQYENVKTALLRDPGTRRAEAVYTRPSMHDDAIKNGRQDFMCTNAVVYLLRDEKLHCIVQMRSSDAVLGYKNDRLWHLFVLSQLASELCVGTGSVYWQAGSLHVYERHFKLLESA